MNRPSPIERMIEVLKKLPGVGPKMAERLSYHLLKVSAAEVESLTSAIRDARRTIKLCSKCFNLSEHDPCPICSDSSRSSETLCVVETPQDLIAVSKAKNYSGLYFVLGGALSPLDAIGPDDIRISQLVSRLKSENIKEIIVATNADSQGEITALYIAELIKPFGTKVSRLGYGMPVGGDIEYADEITIARAIEGRREM